MGCYGVHGLAHCGVMLSTQGYMLWVTTTRAMVWGGREQSQASPRILCGSGRETCCASHPDFGLHAYPSSYSSLHSLFMTLDILVLLVSEWENKNLVLAVSLEETEGRSYEMV